MYVNRLSDVEQTVSLQSFPSQQLAKYSGGRQEIRPHVCAGRKQNPGILPTRPASFPLPPLPALRFATNRGPSKLEILLVYSHSRGNDRTLTLTPMELNLLVEVSRVNHLSYGLYLLSFVLSVDIGMKG